MAWRMITDWFRMRRLGKLGLVGIVALICAGVSAHAAIRAIVDQQARAAAAPARPAGYEAEDHFPGAALFYIADESAAPGAGATGTTKLPDRPLPPEAASLATDASIRPARPFSTANASPTDRARALQCLTTAIYYEAATEPDDGQRAVAQVVLNRVAHPSYPNTVCGVVFQGSERSTGCQFSFTCDGSLARRPAAFWWDRARRVARAALAGAVYAPVGLATHYHTLQVHPTWSNSLVAVSTIGAHRFFRWPGAAGGRAAFSVAYLGGEPAATPHPRVLTPAIDSDPDPVALARAYEATVAHIVPLRAQDRSATPAYSAAVEARGGDALFRADNLPAGGGLSPELERSGQWLQRP